MKIKRQFQTTLNENNKNETNNSKNGQMASAPGSQTHRNTELINVIHGNTVRTQIQFDIDLTFQERS